MNYTLKQKLMFIVPSAIGVFLFVIVAIISLGALKLTERDTIEY